MDKKPKDNKEAPPQFPLAQLACEIRAQGSAEDIAADTVRAVYADNDGKCYPPQRPGPVEEWA